MEHRRGKTGFSFILGRDPECRGKVQSGANTIGVVVPVVVVGAIGVDVPDVVVIVGVRRAQPPNGSVRQTNRTLYAKRLPAVRLRFRVKDGFQGGSLFGQPFPFRFCPEFFGTSAFRREPLHRRVFYVRDLLCPDTGFLRTDDTFLRADGQVFQQQRAAVHNCADLLNALVVVGLEIDVVRRVCIQQDLPAVSRMPSPYRRKVLLEKPSLSRVSSAWTAVPHTFWMSRTSSSAATFWMIFRASLR